MRVRKIEEVAGDVVKIDPSGMGALKNPAAVL